MWRILLQEFWGDLRAQKKRAFLTMFAISWGTISVVLLLAFGSGLSKTMINGTMNMGDRIIMMYGGETSKAFDGLDKGRRIGVKGEDLPMLMKAIPDIEMGSVSYGQWGISLKAKGKTTTYMEGVNSTFEDMRRMFPAAGGRFLNARDEMEKRRVLFLGDEIAAQLFEGEEPVGGEVLIEGLPFKVVGIMQPKLQTSMNNGPDARRAVIPASTFEAIYGHRWVNHLILRPRELKKTEEIKTRIYEVMGSRYKFDPTDERALGLWDFVEMQKEMEKVFMGIQIFLGFMGGLTLLLAGVGVANIMYVTVKERTTEFGIKRALGAPKSFIRIQVIFEALLIALTGGFIGLLLSMSVVSAVSGIENKEGAMEFLANPQLSPTIAMVTVGTLAMIGLLAGFFPARKAAKVHPVEALRYE